MTNRRSDEVIKASNTCNINNSQARFDVLVCRDPSCVVRKNTVAKPSKQAMDIMVIRVKMAARFQPKARAGFRASSEES